MALLPALHTSFDRFVGCRERGYLEHGGRHGLGIRIGTPMASQTTALLFNRDVRPILADNCFECHGPDQESRQADLRLDVLDDELESVIVPGKPNVSVFIERLLSDDEDLVMPPQESKWRSTAKQIAILLLRRRICLLTSHLTLCSSLQPLINNVRINKRPILTKPFLSNLIEHPLL